MEAEMLQAEREGSLIAFINSEKMRNAYLDLVDNAHKFKKGKNMKKTVELWEWRNQIMAERIIEAASQSQAKKVLVTFGAFHVPFVKRYLEKYDGVKVITYDQLKSKKLFTPNN